MTVSRAVSCFATAQELGWRQELSRLDGREEACVATDSPLFTNEDDDKEQRDIEGCY